MKISEFNLNDLSKEHLEKGFQTDYWKTSNLISELVLPRFTISEIGITHRWITHWDNQGLLDNRRDGNEWRRFSFVEYIWLRLIVRLRDFKMPLSNIKQVKKFLFASSSGYLIQEITENLIFQIKNGGLSVPSKYTTENYEKEIRKDFARNKTIFKYFNNLFWIIFTILANRKPYCLVITDKGVCGNLLFADEVTTEFSMKAILRDIVNYDFTIINLHKIVEEFFTNEKISETIIEKISILSDKEKQIIELIRKGDFKELSIKLKDNKEYLVGIKRNKSIDKITNEVSSIINRNKYQEIKLVTEKGKIVNAEITEKIKI
ncbi:MAG TPA: MerR family transcriptional regulator [Puia sp.]|nr:MerR family transcriptional regulator [Puia sp.]